MTIEEAETLALATLKQVMEEKVTPTNVEIGVVLNSTKQFTIYSPDKLEQIIARIPERQ